MKSSTWKYCFNIFLIGVFLKTHMFLDPPIVRKNGPGCSPIIFIVLYSGLYWHFLFNTDILMSSTVIFNIGMYISMCMDMRMGFDYSVCFRFVINIHMFHSSRNVVSHTHILYLCSSQLIFVSVYYTSVYRPLLRVANRI